MKTTINNSNTTRKFNTLLTVLLNEGLVLLSVCYLICKKIWNLKLKELSVPMAQV